MESGKERSQDQAVLISAAVLIGVIVTVTVLLAGWLLAKAVEFRPQSALAGRVLLVVAASAGLSSVVTYLVRGEHTSSRAVRK